MSALETPMAVFDDAEAYLANVDALPDGTPYRVLGADGVDLGLGVYKADYAPSMLFADGAPLRMDGLDASQGWTENLVGTGPATLAVTHGDGYVDFVASGANADDEVLIDLDVFGDGGTGYHWIREIATIFEMDPGSTDTPVDGAYYGIEYVNPVGPRHFGTGVYYDTGAWTRRILYDVGAGEVITSSLDAVTPNVAGCLSVFPQGRLSGGQNWYGDYTVGWGGFLNGETGATGKALSSTPQTDGHQPRVRLRLRCKTGTITARVYTVSASLNPYAVDPS